jgi:hypothetical protein
MPKKKHSPKIFLFVLVIAVILLVGYFVTFKVTMRFSRVMILGSVPFVLCFLWMFYMVVYEFVVKPLCRLIQKKKQPGIEG